MKMNRLDWCVDAFELIRTTNQQFQPIKTRDNYKLPIENNN